MDDESEETFPLPAILTKQVLGRQHRSVVHQPRSEDSPPFGVLVEQEVVAMGRDFGLRIKRAEQQPVPGRKLYYVETDRLTCTLNEHGNVDITVTGDPIWLTDEEAETLKAGGRIEFDKARIQCGGDYIEEAEKPAMSRPWQEDGILRKLFNPRSEAQQ